MVLPCKINRIAWKFPFWTQTRLPSLCPSAIGFASPARTGRDGQANAGQAQALAGR